LPLTHLPTHPPTSITASIQLRELLQSSSPSPIFPRLIRHQGVETKLHDDSEEARTINEEFRRRSQLLKIISRNVRNAHSD
ncbi:hypothetical protein LINGRAHAP2_LOCUS24278, partial [Linum grandiflorum]